MGYTGYKISEASRAQIFETFPPKYARPRADHLTVHFNVRSDHSLPPKAEEVKIIGYADDGNGIEALVVTVNGEEFRPDGERFHITHSYDPSRLAPATFDSHPDPAKRKEQPYKSGHSKRLISERGYVPVSLPFAIEVSAPEFFEDTPPPVVKDELRPSQP